VPLLVEFSYLNSTVNVDSQHSVVLSPVMTARACWGLLSSSQSSPSNVVLELFQDLELCTVVCLQIYSIFLFVRLSEIEQWLLCYITPEQPVDSFGE
jgi:hypothetical protein